MPYVNPMNEMPEDRWVLPSNYSPPKEKKIALFLPCAKTKPYKRSPSHRDIYCELGSFSEYVHILTISEIMGVVPEDLENNIPYYDTYPNEDSIYSAIKSVIDYKKKYNGHYNIFFAYMTSKSFRKVIHNANQELEEDIILLPNDGRFDPKKAFFEYKTKKTVVKKEIQTYIETLE